MYVKYTVEICPMCKPIINPPLHPGSCPGSRLSSLSRYFSLCNKGTGYEIISTSAEAATGMPLCVHCETFLWQLHPRSVFGYCCLPCHTEWKVSQYFHVLNLRAEDGSLSGPPLG